MARAARDPEMSLLLDLLAEAFERKSWHGTNLRGSFRGLTATEAAWRPGGGRRNAWELALHAAYWKYAVRRKLTGEKRGSFALEGSNWFPRPEGEPSEAAWKADLALLAAEHRFLVAAVEARLPGLRGADRAKALHLVRGAAAHDLYHAGQVQLLKRLRAPD
ncbi:MAG: DinB family protein [Thermoanaerobaculia bacterium]